MGNLQEAEYRRRETHMRKSRSEELQEIKSDLLQKLKLMQIRGFQSFDHHLRSHQIRRSQLPHQAFKELKRSYKEKQLVLLEKLLSIKYFQGSASLHGKDFKGSGEVLGKRGELSGLAKGQGVQANDGPGGGGVVGKKIGSMAEIDDGKKDKAGKRVRENEGKSGGYAGYGGIGNRGFNPRSRRVVVRIGKNAKKSESLQKLQEKIYNNRSLEESDPEQIKER